MPNSGEPPLILYTPFFANRVVLVGAGLMILIGLLITSFNIYDIAHNGFSFMGFGLCLVIDLLLFRDALRAIGGLTGWIRYIRTNAYLVKDPTRLANFKGLKHIMKYDEWNYVVFLRKSDEVRYKLSLN